MKTLPKIVLSVALAFCLTGCSTLMPKPVELFQKKVPAYPAISSSALENQREAAALAANEADKVLKAAVATQAPDVITIPAANSAILSKSVSESLGPPLYPATSPAKKVAAALDYSHAKYNNTLSAYSRDVDRYAGKKIEGTGLISVPYFLWLGGVVLLLGILIFVGKLGWTALKVYGNTNPLVAVGTSGVSLVASELAKGFHQVVIGGETFKNSVEAKFGSGSDVAKDVLALFQKSHVTTQDDNIQNAVQQITK
jgi:hypothetical protein